jgi:hypothetical protein
MKKFTLYIEYTTKENASKSWGENTEKLIKDLPIFAKAGGIGGGFFESFDKAERFFRNALKNKKYDNVVITPEITGTGVYTIMAYTQKEMKKRALTAYEDTNMYGGAHTTNYDVALRAAQEGRDIVVHAKHYDGQRYHHSTYRVTNLRETVDGRIIGTTEDGETWEATAELCEYAKTGQI